MLTGLMQDRPLMISSLLSYGARHNGRREVVTREPSGALHRTTYAELEPRTRRLAKGLQRLGVKQGDRVATLAWNTRRHLELFYAVPGIGAVLHTLNPRLWEEQLLYIVAHAEDRVLMFDPDLLPLVTRLAPKLPSVEHFVLIGAREDAPADATLKLTFYEDLLADDDWQWPEFDERAASILCYTSGTTGMPKGVLSSHRSIVLHALAAQSPLAFGLTPQETILLVVPMFHAYGWSLPFIAPIAGAKLVFPGAAPTPATIVDLIHAEGATLTSGVPTVWTGIFENLDATNRDLGTIKRALIGGSAAPPAMIRRLREQYKVEPITGWGMTEMSPLGSFTSTTPEIDALPADEREATLYRKAGRVMYPVEVRLKDSNGAPMPRTDQESGDIWVRGPCIASGYFKGEGGPMLDADGWFPTGDVGAVDEHGCIAITDRVKDLIKSGGEWISSTDLEKAAADCPGVAQAAAIAAAHPKWQERPLLLVVPTRDGVSKDAVLDAMGKTLARWQLPDDVLIVDELPLTATGKVDKKALRARYQDHLIDSAAGESASRTESASGG